MMTNFRERLSELIKESGKTTEQIAEAFNTKSSSIRRWTTCDCSPKLSTLIKFADYFECSIDFLSGRTDNQLGFAPKNCPPFFTQLSEVLRLHKISTYKLDKETPIKHVYLNRWRHGGEPLLPSLIALANYIGCTIDQLVGRESIK